MHQHPTDGASAPGLAAPVAAAQNDESPGVLTIEAHKIEQARAKLAAVVIRMKPGIAANEALIHRADYGDDYVGGRL